MKRNGFWENNRWAEHDPTDQDWRAWEIECRPTYWRDGGRTA